MGDLFEVRVQGSMEASSGSASEEPEAEILQRLRQEAAGNPIRQAWEKPVKLHDGRWVGSWSEDWRLECEAKHLLAMPLVKRRKELAIREEKRGQAAVQYLKDRMTSIHRSVAKSSIAQ